MRTNKTILQKLNSVAFAALIFLVGGAARTQATSISLTAAQAACPGYTETTPCSGCTWSFSSATANVGGLQITHAKQPVYYQNDMDETNCTGTSQMVTFNNQHQVAVEVDWGITVGATGGWTSGPVGWHVDASFQGQWGLKTTTTVTVGVTRQVTIPSCAAIIGWARSRIYMKEQAQITATRLCVYTAPNCDWSIVLWSYLCIAPNTRSNSDSATWAGHGDYYNTVSDKSELDQYTPSCPSTGPCCGNKPTNPPGAPSWWTGDF